jgi:4-hydroxybenzoyl-CoA thioesterase
VGSFVSRRQLTVAWGQCDPAGIVFNPRYFEMFDESSWLLLQGLLGVGQHDFPARYGLIGPALVDARANFLKPARFGDVIEISSRICDVRRSSFDVEHRVTLGGELAVDGGETRLWAARDQRDPDKMRALPIPQEIIDRFGS